MGPKAYTRIYDTYKSLLSDNASLERDEFLAKGGEEDLHEYEKKMEGYATLKVDVQAIRNRATLSLFVVDCAQLNAQMAQTCEVRVKVVVSCHHMLLISRMLNCSFLSVLARVPDPTSGGDQSRVE